MFLSDTLPVEQKIAYSDNAVDQLSVTTLIRSLDLSQMTSVRLLHNLNNPHRNIIIRNNRKNFKNRHDCVQFHCRILSTTLYTLHLTSKRS